jgi:hypothetical protein
MIECRERDENDTQRDARQETTMSRYQSATLHLETTKRYRTQFLYASGALVAARQIFPGVVEGEWRSGHGGTYADLYDGFQANGDANWVGRIVNRTTCR